MKMIQVMDLRKEYGKDEALVKAVDKLSFTVEKGQFVAVVGESGSGKSTLMHLLGGVDEPTGGTVELDGIDIFNLTDEQRSILRRRKIGYIFQDFNLIPVLTAQENIEMPVLLDKKKPDKEYIEELLDLLGLKERKDHLPNQLSGGQQQRVAIGRALANKPKIIFADEPTGNLDKKNSMEIIALLQKSIERYQQTLILITHDQTIAAMADRIIELEDGKIIRDEVLTHGAV